MTTIINCGPMYIRRNGKNLTPFWTDLQNTTVQHIDEDSHTDNFENIDFDFDKIFIVITAGYWKSFSNGYSLAAHVQKMNKDLNIIVRGIPPKHYGFLLWRDQTQDMQWSSLKEAAKFIQAIDESVPESIAEFVQRTS